MLVKGIIDEDFVNYKKPSMYIAFPRCTFKCEKECGQQVCQNSALATAPNIEISVKELGDRYLNNPISEAIVLSGLDPFDSMEDMFSFVTYIRDIGSDDDIVIYTGYTEDEIINKFSKYYNILKTYRNIIIKFGRYIPNQKAHFDSILGVELQSNNQYAKRI